MNIQNIVSLSLETILTCPYDNNHRFPLREGLSEEALQEVKRDANEAHKSLRERVEKELNAEYKENLAIELQKALEKGEREKEKSLREAHERLAAAKEDKSAIEEVLKSLREELTAQRKEAVQLREKLAESAGRTEVEVAQAIAKYKAEERQRLEQAAHEKANATFELERERLTLVQRQLEQQRDRAMATAEDLRRKLAQGSEQSQGECLEIDVESTLAGMFPSDQVSEVAKGIAGADVILEVRSSDGKRAGGIAVECKYTKSFSQAWIQKAKADQLAVGADIAVIISTVLPEGVSSFAEIGGVWVCSLSCWQAVISALRGQLIALHRTCISNVSKDQKLELLYRYLVGPEFRGRVEFLVSKFSEMKQQLDQEKRALTKHWARREKLIGAVTESVSTVYGDLQGTLGAQSLPEIQALSLEEDTAEEA